MAIKDTLKNLGIKVTKRTQKLGTLLSDFGVNLGKGDISRYTKKVARKENIKTLFDAFDIPKDQRKTLKKQFNEQGLNKEEIYNTLSKQTQQAPGGNFAGLDKAVEFSTKNNVAPRDVFKFLKKKTGQFKDTPFIEYGANRPDLFPKVTKKYNLKFGTPSQKQLEQIKEEATSGAQDKYRTEEQLSNEYIQESLNRLKQDYGLSESEARQYLSRNTQDIATQEEIGARKYSDQLSANELQALQEQQGLTADINASGQWDSSLRNTRQAQLGQTQSMREGDIKNTYQDYLNNIALTKKRGLEDYTSTIGKYKRAKNRGVWDINQLEKQRAESFGQSKQDYANQYVSDVLSEIGQESQDYYDRQNQIASDAAQYTEDLYNSSAY